jgi:hypothetical protein
MRTKASTAALDPFSQRPLLLGRRVPRRPASGQELQEARHLQGPFSFSSMISCFRPSLYSFTTGYLGRGGRPL